MPTKEKKFKICLLGATFSTNNMGVSALTDGAIRCILHHYPDAQIYLLDYGESSVIYQYASDRVMNIPLINMRFSKKVYLHNNILLVILLVLLWRRMPIKSIRKKIIHHNSCLERIFAIDAFASLAGGDSFSDIYGLRNLLYVSLPQILVLLCQKTLILLPQTLGPFRKKLSRYPAKFILNRAEQIYIRDHTSIHDVKALFKASFNDRKIRFCYDVGFAVKPAKPAMLELPYIVQEKKYSMKLIGLNISGLLFMGGYTRNNMFELKIAYDKLIYDVIHKLITSKNALLLLVPHVFGDATHMESDSEVCRTLYEKLAAVYPEKILYASGRYDQREIKYIIGLCDMFIGSRMHACIAALSQNIPTVALAYSKKFFGVMNSIDMDSYVADLRYCEKNEIFNLIDRVWQNKRAIRKQLELKMPRIQQELFNFFNFDFLGDHS